MSPYAVRIGSIFQGEYANRFKFNFPVRVETDSMFSVAPFKENWKGQLRLTGCERVEHKRLVNYHNPSFSLSEPTTQGVSSVRYVALSLSLSPEQSGNNRFVDTACLRNSWPCNAGRDQLEWSFGGF